MISIGTAIGFIIAAFVGGSWFGLLIAGLAVTASDRKEKKNAGSKK